MQVTTDISKRDERLLPSYSAAESTRKQQPRKGGDGEAGGKGKGSQKLAKKGEELKEEMDALVDEIDEVLEENAEEFVKNYVHQVVLVRPVAVALAVAVVLVEQHLGAFRQECVGLAPAGFQDPFARLLVDHEIAGAGHLG